MLATCTLKQTVADGVLVEIFKHRWGQLAGGKPIVATAHLFSEVSLAGLDNCGAMIIQWFEGRRRKHIDGVGVTVLGELCRRMHFPVPVQSAWLRSVLLGHQTAPKHALRYCGNKTTVFLRVQKSFYSLKASICRLNIQKAV
jgi:hypothetical protein